MHPIAQRFVYSRFILQFYTITSEVPMYYTSSMSCNAEGYRATCNYT